MIPDEMQLQNIGNFCRSFQFDVVTIVFSFDDLKKKKKGLALKWALQLN